MISIALIHLMRFICPNIDVVVEAFVDSSVNPKRLINFPVLDICQVHERLEGVDEGAVMDEHPLSYPVVPS